MKRTSNRLWQLILAFVYLIIGSISSCSKAKEGIKDDETQRGDVTGFVKTQSGTPLKGVKMIIDHSILFNANLSGVTDHDGKYRVKVPNGSWYAFAQHEVAYNGKVYQLYLHPDNASGFGGEGAVRNFEWKLTGTKPQPLSGHYGGLVTIDRFPGVYIDAEEIEFIFSPEGPLIDGSAGGTLHMQAADAFHMPDIPIGKYKLTATYEGKALQFRKWNSQDAFTETYELDFEPQIASQCNNCAKLEYYWEP